MVGGDPGIGKSTLMLQMFNEIKSSKNLLYISGEESKSQVRLRGERLGFKAANLLFSAETNLQNLLFGSITLSQ